MPGTVKASTPMMGTEATEATAETTGVVRMASNKKTTAETPPGGTGATMAHQSQTMADGALGRLPPSRSH